MKLPEFNTTKEAKEYLRANWEKGTNCPCCGQYVKLYKRRFNSGMARSLLIIYRLTKAKNGSDKWLHLQREFANLGINSNAADYSSLKWWGLIEPAENDDPSKKTSGFWQITDSGIAFAEKRTKISTRAFLYNNKFCGFSTEKIDIKEALQDKFDYEELMSE